MSKLVFSIELNSRLVGPALEMHQASRVGDQRTGPNQSFESFLADLVTVAIVERILPRRVEAPNLDRKLSA